MSSNHSYRRYLKFHNCRSCLALVGDTSIGSAGGGGGGLYWPVGPTGFNGGIIFILLAFFWFGISDKDCSAGTGSHKDATQRVNDAMTTMMMMIPLRVLLPLCSLLMYSIVLMIHLNRPPW
jgi:hypothetical protein